MSGFSGVALTKCFRSIFYFGQIPIRKLNQNSCGYAYQHIMSFITTKFLEILLSGFRGVVLTRKQNWRTDWRTGEKHNTVRNFQRGVKWRFLSYKAISNTSTFQIEDNLYSRKWLGMSCRCAIKLLNFFCIPGVK